jgi:Cdc6-like AAA superfamily ATPase
MAQNNLKKLRSVINESLRVQRGGADPIPYIDISNVLTDAVARQNHAVFGRRGCGKTLLLRHSADMLPTEVRSVYLNCEDFKKHSFPNVLIEILDALFAELEKQLRGWFGKKRRSREVIVEIRKELQGLREKADRRETQIQEAETVKTGDSGTGEITLGKGPVSIKASENLSEYSKREIERKYTLNQDKIRELDLWLPRLKQQIREFFELSNKVRSVFLQIDDFYHLTRPDQPLVMDYIHRLCKDVPLYFKIATLRHASTLYADRLGQPIGAQE